MVRIDLDAAAAARREALGEPVELLFRGETFVLPVEMPLEVLVVLPQHGEDASDLEAAASVYPLCKALLGDDDWQRFLALRPSLQDLEAFVDAAMDAYAVDPTQAPESPRSSNRATRRSRPTSARTTGSAPGKRSTARTG